MGYDNFNPQTFILCDLTLWSLNYPLIAYFFRGEDWIES
jgi:hypothetical protein